MRGLRNAIALSPKLVTNQITWDVLIQGWGAECTERDVHFRTQHFVSAHYCAGSV